MLSHVLCRLRVFDCALIDWCVACHVSRIVAQVVYRHTEPVEDKHEVPFKLSGEHCPQRPRTGQRPDPASVQP